MIVPDSARMPANMGTRPPLGQDCDRLWNIGVRAGGIDAEQMSYSLLLRGAAREGVDITAMRAEVTRRTPAIDGTALSCALQKGGAWPISLTFSLKDSSSSPAQRLVPGQEPEDPFASGFIISVKENESVPLDITALLPEEAIEWHIEADIIVGGKRRTLIINDEGKEFYGPGRRKNYERAYGGGQIGGTWDHSAPLSELRRTPPR